MQGEVTWLMNGEEEGLKIKIMNGSENFRSIGIKQLIILLNINLLLIYSVRRYYSWREPLQIG